jgi:tRNA-dihydrouridine synthase C
MKLILAPMEGLLDAPMRDLLGRIGGYDYAISEFIRVTEQRLPRRTLLRLCPELKQHSHTSSGLGVWPQLLGSHPETMASTAQQLAALGALGIDLNFGCPSNGVNRKRGGAILLREPERVYRIINAVRRAVDPAIPISAKIRLGYEDTHLAIDNAQAVESAGACQITVHARTKSDGYHAPARWEWLAVLRERIDIPLIANGDIRSVEDYWRCREISGCEQVMIGRAAVGRPDIARQIRHSQQGQAIPVMAWNEVLSLWTEMAVSLQAEMLDRHIASRAKQWLAMLRPYYPEAHALFAQIRPLKLFSEIRALLSSHGMALRVDVRGSTG